MKSDYIWMDGELMAYEDATIHFICPTLHYGVGVFEGIRCYQTPKGPAIFRLREHLERFLNSIHILGINDFPYSRSEMREAVHKTIKANGFSECYIRPLMYLDGPMGMDMDQSRPKLGIATWEWGPYLGEEAERTGVQLMVSSFTRLHPNIQMTKAKTSGNYVNSMLAKTLALRSGYAGAVLLDPDGFVAEGSGDNLFLVRAGVIYTTPKATILEGITRDAIITLATDMGIRVVEELITRDQLYIADEVFVCGTATEVVGVTMIDHRGIGDGRVGSITRQLLEVYKKTVCGDGMHSEEWLDYVE